MAGFRRLSRTIDAVNGVIGRILAWVAVLLIVLGVINVVGRYLGAHLGMQLSSNAVLEAQTQAFNLIFLLGAAWLLMRGGHIRVDILYGRFGPRLREWVDLIGHVLILIPFSLTMMWLSWDYVMRSWTRLEVSPNPGGLPLYPIKTVILLAFLLLALQGLSEIIKRVDALRQIAAQSRPGTDPTDTAGPR